MHFLSVTLLLFAAGILTLLLPCILPLLPIAVGAGVAGRHPLRPLVLALGMVVGFVGITFLLHVLLSSFVLVANAIQIGTYQVLFLFGLAFLFERRSVLLGLSALSGLFFWSVGWVAVVVAAVAGAVLMELGGTVAARLQSVGGEVQGAVRGTLGERSLFAAFLFGLTMGLIWVPCAGPALGFALTLVRTQPGVQAFAALTSYAVGAALPVLLLGYGGQWVGERMKGLRRFSGKAKHLAGVIFLSTAVTLRFGWLMDLQTWLVNNTSFGTLGNRIEETFFPADMPMPATAPLPTGNRSSLPRISRAPELRGTQEWFNSEPFTLAELRGRVVLVDFWTYSCINCIRTLPYLRGYAEKFADAPFVIVGVHTPEFVFEKDPKNVRAAIAKYGLTYPVVQDNDYATWSAFANRYWPAKYLIDAEGVIRYTHFGEGAYDETDAAIQSLLAELGEAPKDRIVDMPEASPRRPLTPETYLHSRSWSAFGNGTAIPTEATQAYTAPGRMEPHTYYLDGVWTLVDDERQVLRSREGEIRMKWLGGEINLVMGLEEGASPVAGEVWIDGARVGSLTVDHHDLYPLYKGAYGEHELVLRLTQQAEREGVAAYAFTFGQ